jgi:hypothetical protein
VQTTKRRLLYIGGATIAGGIGLIATSDQTSANVQLKELTIPDKTKGITGDVTDVILATSFTYSFESNTSMDSCVFQLRVGIDESDLAPITGVRKTSVGSSASGSEELQGSVLDHGSFTASLFDPSTGGTVKRGLVVELRMQLKKNGQLEHTASAQANPVITVTDETVTVESSLEGSGGATVVA